MGQDADTVKAAYEAFAARDVEAMASHMAEDIVWTAPGDSPISGRKEGREAVLANLAKTGEISGGTFRPVPETIFDDGNGNVAVFGRATGDNKGVKLDIPFAQRWQVEGGQIKSVQIFPGDQAAADAFWNA